MLLNLESVVTHGFVNAADGRKMSKSYNNTVDPIEVTCLISFVILFPMPNFPYLSNISAFEKVQPRCAAILFYQLNDLWFRFEFL